MKKFKLTRALKKVFKSGKNGRGVFSDAHKYLTGQGVPRSLRGARLGLRRRMHIHDQMYPEGVEVKTDEVHGKTDEVQDIS